MKLKWETYDRKNRNNEGMLIAIDMFPKDWTFRNSKYILDLEQNSVIGAEHSKQLANSFAREIPGAYDKLLERRVNEFYEVINRREMIELKYNKELIPGNAGYNLYNGLADALQDRYNRFKRTSDFEQIKYYRDLAQKALKISAF